MNILKTGLKRISVVGGDVMHGIKKSDIGYEGFGEAYFSLINPGAIKAWKKHNDMIMNLMVPQGEVLFAFYNESDGELKSEIIGEDCYSRLTVPAGIWFGFKGLGSKTSVILNLADIEHKPEESERLDRCEINFDWDGK